MGAAHIWIVSPASAKANNGNWQTAKRWARFLRTRYRVTLTGQWPSNSDIQDDPALLIALHARRSAASLAAFAAANAQRPSILLLTGTDLYRDISTDAEAQASLTTASALVLLQPAGLSELSPALRTKATVIYQSAPTLLASAGGPRRFLDITLIGHLRAEKDPATFMRAAALVTAPRVRMIHIGTALEPELGRLAIATQESSPCYRWLGPVPHGATRQRLKRSHLMVLTSLMEGGANVIIEAITSGVPVIASDIKGNRGMLGDDYAGYFPAGDAAALAGLIERSVSDPAFYRQLRTQCAVRAPLFAPAAEQAALLQLVDNLLHRNSSP